MEEQGVSSADQAEGASDPAGSGTKQAIKPPQRRKVNRRCPADKAARQAVFRRIVIPALRKDPALSVPQTMELLKQEGDLGVTFSKDQLQRLIKAYFNESSNS